MNERLVSDGASSLVSDRFWVTVYASGTITSWSTLLASDASRLYDAVWLKPARRAVPCLDLYRRMIDAELLVQRAGKIGDVAIALDALRHNEMHRKRGIRRTERPDMKIMDSRHAGA